MIRFYKHPDPLIEPLPKFIRVAYRLAEEVLMEADNLVLRVREGRADLLPGAIGRLLVFHNKALGAALDVEADLAPGRKSTPVVVMREVFTTGYHAAAVGYGEKVMFAVKDAIHPDRVFLDLPSARDRERSGYWTRIYRDRLAEYGVLSCDAKKARPGAGWETFKQQRPVVSDAGGRYRHVASLYAGGN